MEVELHENGLQEISSTSCVFRKLAGLVKVRYEPVGRWYESFCSRRHHKHTLSHGSAASSSFDESDAELSADDEDEDKVLETLDPKEWKKQDHYAVLGLAKLRYKATEEQIKRAYKKKVLRHHPDKRRARGLPVKKQGEEDYFTCVTRAYEILGNTLKRRSYDSVDPLFDDDVPANNADSKQNFYEVFGPVFERNSRWSLKKPVPQLGDKNQTFDQVNKFYSFWYNIESWREYSYLDEEEKDKGENREERRWIEKQNKGARLKLKKEETSRIRQLVDNAYACDPRIAQFKFDEKERKQAGKRAKQELLKQKADEEERAKQKILEEERLKKEKEEEEAKSQALAAKKEKEAQKKMMQKERKSFRTSMKELSYLAENDAERVRHMQDVDKLAELLSAVSLQKLNEVLSSGDRDKSREAFLMQVNDLNEQLEEEKRQQLDQCRQTQSSGSGGGGKSTKAKDNWSEMEIQMLIKAVNLFPAGTNARWEAIANFMKLHCPVECNRSAKDVLAKAKDLQKNDLSLKEDANKKAFEHFAKESQSSSSVEVSEVSERYETAAETQVYEVGSNPAPWTADEQKLLEQAMRTYSANVPDRWDKIADCIPCRTKKDCMKRYKELVEVVRMKKLAQAEAAKKK